MKRITLTITFSVFLLCSSLTSSNEGCSFNDLFPLKFGTSKFEALKFLNTNENIYDVEDYMNYWSHTNSGKDSVWNSILAFKYKTHPCLKGYEFSGRFNFGDYKLKSIQIFSKYTPDLSKCISNMEELILALKKTFPYAEKYNVSHGANNNEQIGEGYDLYKTENPFGNKVPFFEQISIDYSFNKERIYIDGAGWKDGQKISSYDLQICYSRLKYNKTDNSWNDY